MKSKKIVLISLVAFLLVAAGIYNYDYLYGYYKTRKYDHFHPGDKIYASDKFLSDKSLTIFIQHLTKNKSAPYNCSISPEFFSISSSALQNNKNACIGTCISSKVIQIKPGKYILFYAIEPNWSLVDKSDGNPDLSAQPGYELMDNNYYILGTTTFIK